MKTKVIYGPPGTGKTRRLVEIAGKETARANAILYLSYTRSAAEEAMSRIKHEKIKPSTIHSFAFNALGMNRAAVVDAKKLAEFGKAAGIPFKGSEPGIDEPQEGDEYATVLEYAENRIIPAEDAWEHFGRPGTKRRFEIFVESYNQWKKTYGYMDFNDMLSKFAAAPFTNRRADVVILDEAQDCTPLQWQAFLRIIENAKNVYIAGDDDQAIYEWSGANPHGMADFAESTDATVEVLDQSYRVPARVHSFALDLIGQVGRRAPKEFKPKNAQGQILHYGDVWDINMHSVEKTGGAMILVRDQFRRKEITKDLNRNMIPYDVLGGHSPWTSRVAADLRDGKKPEIPSQWRDFYRMADLTQPIKITVSTIHQAKGREANRVILDTALPARVERAFYLDADAERRVWYVGLTRAADELFICGSNAIL
jgi:superfamily I DNA/RNA helicase